MKKLWSLIIPLTLAVLLCACGGETPQEEVSPSPSPSPSAVPGTPAPTPTVTPEPEPSPEPTPEPAPYTNPLTGEGCDTDIGANRPVAIMVNNLKKALPQLGMSQADIIYEVPAEGGITRMLALFQSVEGVGEIGSVRSARDYYVSLALGHDAVFLHAGGSPAAYTAIKEWGVTALDCVNGPYEGTLFWRDAARRKSMGLEHSVLTSGEKILELLPTYKKVTLEHKDGYVQPLRFTQDGTPAGGSAANELSVRFSSYKTGVFTYDPALGKYLVEEYGAPYVDGNTDEQVAVTNVLVLFTDQAKVPGDEKARITVRTTGTGTGYYACGGKYVEINWSKADHETPLSYTTRDGVPLTLGVGNTYVNIVATNAKVEIS